MTATYDFKGKIILVTGAGAGIGRAVCKRLVASNAKVIAVSLLHEELDALKKELPVIKTVQVDLSDWAATRKAIEGVVPVDGLVNNAGVGGVIPFFDSTEQQFDLQYAVNVKAVINVSQVVAKSMIENNIKGSIVNLSSIAALTALKGGTIYNGSKSALQSMTSVMALELGPHGIRVNSVNPTVVKTELFKSLWQNEELAAKFLQRTPMGRFLEPDEVAQSILFLLSDESSMVHGIPLPVDGGFLV